MVSPTSKTGRRAFKKFYFRYPTKKIGTKEAEMKTQGCELHAKQQIIAMVDTEAGEFTVYV